MNQYMNSWFFNDFIITVNFEMYFLLLQICFYNKMVFQWFNYNWKYHAEPLKHTEKEQNPTHASPQYVKMILKIYVRYFVLINELLYGEKGNVTQSSYSRTIVVVLTKCRYIEIHMYLSESTFCRTKIFSLEIRPKVTSHFLRHPKLLNVCDYVFISF